MLRVDDRAPVTQVHLKQTVSRMHLLCLDCLGCLEAPVILVDPESREHLTRQDCPAGPDALGQWPLCLTHSL